MTYIAGVDEAGRGPVLGPLVMSIVAIQKKDKSLLQKLGVKDSKVVKKDKRKKLARIIQTNFTHQTIKVSPEKIDQALRSPTSSLNILEAKTTAKLIEQLAKKVPLEKVMIDLPTKNKEEYIITIQSFLPSTLQSLILEAEFKADENYVQVSAASLLAKVARDTSLVASQKKLEFPIGSGYPSDPLTIKALKHHLDELFQTSLVRKEWKTIKILLEKKQQSSLNDF